MYTITDPETKQVAIQQIVQQQFPQLRLTSLTIAVSPTDSANISARVGWVEGYMDGDTFVAGQQFDATISKAPLRAKLDEASTEATVWTDIEKRMWELLQAAGEVPGGTIS
jgi:hypothetical protein